MASPAGDTTTDATMIGSYAEFYEKTPWAEMHVDVQVLLDLFKISEGEAPRSADSLYEDVQRSSQPSCSSEKDGAKDASPLVATRHALERLKTPCAKWARRFPWWGPLTHG